MAASNINAAPNSKIPLVGPSLKMHGKLGEPLTSPNNDGKSGAGFPSGTDEKGFGNGGPGSNIGALGMGGQGRLGLDANGNALTVHKRQPKEETV